MLRDIRQRNRIRSDPSSRPRSVSFADEAEKRKLSDAALPPFSPLGFFEWCNGGNLIYFFFTLCYFCAILLFVHRCHTRLLQNCGEKSIFNGTKARSHLVNITSLGTWPARPAGSFENDVLTVEYLANAVDEIKTKAKNELYNVLVELQHAKQCGLTLNRYGQHFSAAGNNITNVIVLLKPKHAANDDVVLVNCHFDTQPGTRGASDDTASCAVMLQAIETILTSPKYHLNHGILFLFNGAEESILVAAHGYVTQHWSMKHVRVLINLEAAGSGGKQLLFQAGPNGPWLTDLYVKNVPHPFASVFGQEVFQSGIIPSDTDFRVFRDYGNISGIDIAYIKNGYVYHTRNDVPDVIPFGSLQSAGDNLVALMEGIANSPFLTSDKKYEHGKMVFFDVFGLFAVSFPFRIFQVLNFGFSVISLAFVAFQVIKPGKVSSDPTILSVSIAIGTVIISLAGGGLTVAILGAVLTKTGNSLTWYSQPLFGVALYGGPCLATMLFCHVKARRMYYKMSNLGKTNVAYLMEDSCMFAFLILVSLLLLFLTYKHILSSFLILAWLAFPFIGYLISRHFHTGPPQFRRHVVASLSRLLGHFIPASFCLYHLYTLYEVFVPIVGRTGTEIPSEAFVGAIVFISVACLSTFLISSVHSIDGVGRTLIIISALLYIPFLAALSGRMFPYAPLTAKRMFVQHTQRTFWNENNEVVKEDSGIWLVPFDYLNVEPLRDAVPALRDAKMVDCDGPYCGYPPIYPIRFGIRKTWYLKAEKPRPSSPVALEVVSRTHVSDLVERLSIKLTGPTRLNIYLVPYANVSLVDWNMADSPPRGLVDYDGRKCYFVYMTSGYYSPPWNVTLELQKPSADFKGPLVEFAVASHHFQGDGSSTKELTEFQSLLPDWVVETAWVSSYDRFLI